jgi:hypothetical protein
MQRKKKELPMFQNEDEEREFWASHDSTDYLNWDGAKRVNLPNLNPTPETESIRLADPD